MSAVLDGGMPKYLITKASQIGYCFGKLVRDNLKLHAFINMRKAQGLISIAEKYGSDMVEEAAGVVIQKRLSVTPKSFKILIEKRQSKKQETTKSKYPNKQKGLLEIWSIFSNQERSTT